MDPPRRGTLRPSGDPHFNARSAIPAPASTVKKLTPSAIRQSLAGAQLPFAFPQGGPRQSLHPGHSQNVPPSASKMANPAFGRTPMRNSMHKAPLLGAGRTSQIAPPTPGARHALKDLRNIRDKGVQTAMRSVIFAWLQETEFDSNIPKQFLVNPTNKEFRSIFLHLAFLLDSSYEFEQNGRKYEDEVIPWLKAHQYPFADVIDRKWLAMPASPFSWPSLLGMLYWLTELGKAKCNYIDSNDSTLQSLDQVPENFEDQNHHSAVAFAYCCDAYAVFLDGADDFSAQDQSVEDRYARKNESVLQKVESLGKELQTLSTEYTWLAEKPAPIEELENEFTSRSNDKKKFEEYFSYYKDRKRKVEEAINRGRADIAAESASLEAMQQEHERLKIIVKEQNLSPEEVAQMNSEQENLNRQIEDLRRKVNELGNQMRSIEIALAKRCENVEQAVDEYTDYLDKLGLFPQASEKLTKADIRLEINFSSQETRNLIKLVASGQGADLNNDIKHVVKDVAERNRKAHQNVEDELVNLEQDLDEINVEADKIEEGILEVERRTSAVHEEAETIRILTQEEGMASNGEVVRLQKELAHARTVALANGRGVKSRLQALQIAYQEQIERVDRLKDETVRMVLKSSSDIAAFKEEVTGHLGHLRKFAEEN